MSAADTAWAEHTDAYAIGRASRDAEVAELKAKLERAEERIADLRAVASRMVCDSVQSYGVSDAFCGCVTCQVKGYVGKEGEP